MKNPGEKQLSDAERLELADKLDKELDEFIENLPRRPQQEAVPFERWEEEITNHPFFMKEFPENGEPIHPLYEGLQKLKYDPEENEPEELALAYKDDGNFNYKHKKYRMAILSYTEGLKAKCGNPEIESSLHNNRAAAHYMLKNYKSSLVDCEAALKLKPHYEKALIRAGNCCMNMAKYDKSIELFDLVLEKNKEHKEVLDLRKEVVKRLKQQERDRRKKAMEAAKLKQEEDAIIAEIIKRGIQVEDEECLTLSSLEPKFPQLFDSRVYLNGNGELIWPVVLFYPEYKIMDYIQEFNEAVTFQQQLAEVFSEFPPWDLEKKYRADSVNVFFESEQRKNVKIDVKKSLKAILQSPGHLIKDGTPRFIILVVNSHSEKMFLKP